MTKPPAGFVNVVTRVQWKDVIDFVKTTNSRLVTSFAVSDGVPDAQAL
jgi:heparanase